MEFKPGNWRIRDRSGNLDSCDDEPSHYKNEVELREAIQDFLGEALRYNHIELCELDLCVEYVEIHEMTVSETPKYDISID